MARRGIRLVWGVTMLLAVGAGWGAHGADAPSARPEVRVAIFSDEGGKLAHTRLREILESRPGFTCEVVDGAAIRGGALLRADVLIQPGGSGSKQAATLGKEGRDEIRRFVRHGGGYLGICAGAYLASADYDWSLHILDARVLDRQHWARGTGSVEMRLDEEACRLLGCDRPVVSVYYGQGPLLAPAGKDDIPDYDELAVYQTEIAKNGAPEGVMKGTTAAAAGTFGQGRVLCFSPHPEKTAGLEHFIPAAVRWAAGGAAPAEKTLFPSPTN